MHRLRYYGLSPWNINLSNRLCLILFFLIILVNPGFPKNNQDDINYSDKNINYMYDPGTPIKVTSKVMYSEGEATIFLKITMGRRDTLQQVPKISYQITDTYEENIALSDSLNWENHLINKTDNNYYLKWQAPVNINNDNVIILRIFYPPLGEEPFYYDIPVAGERNFPPADIMAMDKDLDIPVFNNFMMIGDNFRIKTVNPNIQEVFVYYYNNDFGPNPPPMAEEEQVQKELNIDSVFSVPVNEPLSFSNEGLYFIQSDTTSLSGISFRITDTYFPKYKRVSQLIGPLRYISTNDEMEALRSEEEKKEALDKFWLDITQSRERAKQIIRNYYQQVTLTNKIFTGYKEGWKTGQGMIYLLYGVPDEVYRDGKEEVWIYHERSNLNEMQFTFVKVKNLFTQNHYELIRNNDYKKYWYRNIDLWRKGRKNI